MLRTRRFHLLIFTLLGLSLACSEVTAVFSVTQSPVPRLVETLTQSMSPTESLQPQGTATRPVLASTATEREPTATVSATRTQGATPTYDVLAPMMDLVGISQYFQPTGVPLKVWQGVPVMAQATAGQEFKGHIYSYIATATLAQARQFYAGKAATLGLPDTPATGYSGTGEQANHSVTFFTFQLTIVLTSYDNDQSHVIVVIDKAP